jgi:hypothetical protein
MFTGAKLQIVEKRKKIEMYFFLLHKLELKLELFSFSFSLSPLIFISLCWVYRVEHAEPSLTAVAVISILGLMFFLS